MRRTRPLLLSVMVTLALFGSTACGVAANTTAATVAGVDVQVDDVDTLAADQMFTGAPASEGNESTLPGETARNVLAFEIERVAWIAEAERWGLEITDADRSSAGEQLDAQTGQSGGGAFAGRTRELLVDYLAAQAVLTERFSQIDPSDEGDLRMLYDGSSSLWDRVCLVVTRVPVDQIDEVDAALDEGVAVDGLPDRIDGAEVVAQPSDTCISQGQLPVELREAIATTSEGGTSGVVLVDDGAGGRTGFVFRLDERQSVDFAAAMPELNGIADSLVTQGPRAWVQLQVSEAEINPRYGSGVSVGSSGELAITPPPAPKLPISSSIIPPTVTGSGADPRAATGGTAG